MSSPNGSNAGGGNSGGNLRFMRGGSAGTVTTAVAVAPQRDQGQIVLVLGASLLFVQWVNSSTGAHVVHNWLPFLPNVTTNPSNLSGNSFKLELVFLFALWILARLDPRAGSFAITLLVALWLLFLLNFVTHRSVTGGAAQAGQQAASIAFNKQA